LKDIFKLINNQNCLTNQCKMVNMSKWRYCKISHIVGVRLAWTKFKNLTVIPSLCCDSVINQVLKCNYNTLILVIISLPFTINVTNLTISSFIWINMYGMIYWAWNGYFKKILLFMNLKMSFNNMWRLNKKINNLK